MKYCENAFRTLYAMLREIFDESAYSRFLARQNLPTSKEAYAEFTREKTQLTSQPRRCC